jgi:ABC-type sugar transport system permease subunit
MKSSSELSSSFQVEIEREKFFSGWFRRWIPSTKAKRKEQLWGWLTIAPALILILGLTLYPVAYSIWLSLLEKHSFFPDERFVGLDNYLYLWKDPEFWSSLWLGVVD